jgi:predicted ATP-dependent protease
VIIPEKNVRNLMLKQEVVDAVKEGKFHIWPVSRIEEGIEILTGVPAGELQPDGTYPEGTIFRKADDRLREIAEIVKQFGKDENGGAKGASDEGNAGGCPTCDR